MLKNIEFKIGCSEFLMSIPKVCSEPYLDVCMWDIYFVRLTKNCMPSQGYQDINEQR